MKSNIIVICLLLASCGAQPAFAGHPLIPPKNKCTWANPCVIPKPCLPKWEGCPKPAAEKRPSTFSFTKGRK